MNTWIWVVMFGLVSWTAAKPKGVLNFQDGEPIESSFSCVGRNFGYYADLEYDCRVFHICLPSAGLKGEFVIQKSSFVCKNNTIFNQESLNCALPEVSLPCSQAPDFYEINEIFGHS